MQSGCRGVTSPDVTPIAPHLAGLVCAALLGLIGVGCQALQQVDWNGRIGQFSYEQAVTELGQPTGETKLPGGMRRAEWITNTGISTGGALVGVGYQRRTMSMVPLDPTEIHRLRDRYLRLTFDKEGRLVASENGTKTGY
ncbi:MAG: hypothetical protein OSB55_02885 [Verrucomicrobiota bacterium]|nr:hypothetical protein [Verrucomicrobiota bacterium]